MNLKVMSKYKHLDANSRNLHGIFFVLILSISTDYSVTRTAIMLNEVIHHGVFVFKFV